MLTTMLFVACPVLKTACSLSSFLETAGILIIFFWVLGMFHATDFTHFILSHEIPGLRVASATQAAIIIVVGLETTI